MTTTITALPPAPSDRTDPAVYNSTANTWAAALPTWTTQVNTVGDEITTIGNNATTSANTASTQAGIATTKAAEAALSAVQAAASAGATATLWVSGTNYTAGTLQYSPIDGATYRRIIGGATTLDPSLDYTNYRSITRKDGVGTVQMLSPTYSANQVVFPNGTKFLRTGVVVTKTDAQAANYDVTTLESTGWKLPLPITGVGAIRDIVYGGGKFVAVGDTGLVKYSTDGGLSWTTATSGTSTSLLEVFYVNSTFIASGSATVISSTDGISWSTKVTPTGTTMENLNYINGIYQHCRAAYGNFYSSDLVTWVSANNIITQISPATSTKTLFSTQVGTGIYDSIANTWIITKSVSGTAGYAVGYANSKYFTFSTSGTSFMAYSSDGVSWTNGTTPPSTIGTPSLGFSCVVYGNSIYVAATNTNNTVMSSTDGITWTNRTSASAATQYGITYLNTLFFNYAGQKGGSASISYSTDGINWTLATGTFLAYTAMAYGAGTYVAVGGNNSANAHISSSTNGSTWTTQVNIGSSIGFNDVIFANSLFVAVGENGIIYTSPNGTTWTSRTSSAGAVSITRIHRTNNVWFATYPNGFMWSSDAMSWNNGTLSGQASSFGTMTYVIYDGSNYIFLGNNTYFSTGRTSNYSATVPFNKGPSNSQMPAKITFNGTRLVGSCNGGTDCDSFCTSLDGLSWTGVTKPSAWGNADLANQLLFLNGNFVALNTNIVYRSTTGIDWSTAGITVTGLGTATDIAYGNGIYYLVGTTTNSTSTNLTTWTNRSATYILSRVAFGTTNFLGIQQSAGGGAIYTIDGTDGGIGAAAGVAITNASTYLQVT